MDIEKGKTLNGYVKVVNLCKNNTTLAGRVIFLWKLLKVTE